MRYIYRAALLLPLTLFFVVALDYSLSLKLFIGYQLYDIKRILELGVLLWLALFMLISFSERRIWLQTWHLLAYKARGILLIILGLGVLSALLAAVPKMALLEVLLYFLLACFAIFIAAQRIVMGRFGDKVLLTVVMLAIVIYEAIFFRNYLFAVINHAQSFNFYPGFVHPRFLAQFLTWTLLLSSLPILLVSRQKRALRFGINSITYVVSGLWWAIAILNGAKGMLLGLLLAAIFGVVVWRGAIKKWLLVQLQVIAIGAILYVVLFVLLIPSSGFTPMDGSVTTRWPLWYEAIRLILAHPLLGVGPMHFAYHINSYAAHPHDSLLLIASEWGIPVLLLVLSLIVWGAKAWLHKFNRNDTNVISKVLAISLVAAAGHSLVSGILVMPLSQIMLALTIGWMVGVYYADQSLPEVIPRCLGKELLLMLFMALAMAGIIVGIVPAIFSLHFSAIQWFMQHPSHGFILNPRFWSQGWIGP